MGTTEEELEHPWRTVLVEDKAEGMKEEASGGYRTTEPQMNVNQVLA